MSSADIILFLDELMVSQFVVVLAKSPAAIRYETMLAALLCLHCNVLVYKMALVDNFVESRGKC